MIISHERKFIYIKTIKTAGTSLEIALSKLCGPGDVLTPLGDDEGARVAYAGAGARNYRVPRQDLPPRKRLRAVLRGVDGPYRYYEHIPAWQVRRLVGEGIWRDYFKFTITRNPFDYIISRYFSDVHFIERLKMEHQWSLDSFDQFLRHFSNHINENWMLYTEEDEIIVDFVGRYENLKEDLAEVSRRIGLDRNIHADMASIKAKGTIRPTGAGRSPVLQDRHRQLVSLLCAKEIERFYDPQPARAELEAQC